MNLQTEAEKRKARLLALKKKRKQSKSQATVKDTAEPHAVGVADGNADRPTDGEDVGMDHRTEAAAVAAADDVTMHTATKTVEEHAEAIMHDTKAIEATQKDELDLVQLAPKKPNWDLKRDMAKQQAILDRHTQKAIAELIRQRLSETSNSSAEEKNVHLAQDVALHDKHQANDDDEDIE